MKIYVCSSWRNEHYYTTLQTLSMAGHDTWDWRNPPTGGNGFRWQDVGQSDYKHGYKVSPQRWFELLRHPIAKSGFAADLCGMIWCDQAVLLHPCGRSAHLEAGYIAGMGKKVHVLAFDHIEPDLMVLALRGELCCSGDHLLQVLRK